MVIGLSFFIRSFTIIHWVTGLSVIVHQLPSIGWVILSSTSAFNWVHCHWSIGQLPSFILMVILHNCLGQLLSSVLAHWVRPIGQLSSIASTMSGWVITVNYWVITGSLPGLNWVFTTNHTVCHSQFTIIITNGPVEWVNKTGSVWVSVWAGSQWSGSLGHFN